MILLLLVLWSCRPAFATGEDESSSCKSDWEQEGCTIGVASRSATADKRPLLWKVRDNSELPNNSVSFDTSYSHRFIAVTNSGGIEVWMGVNERGFAIINSTALDLPGGSSGFGNGLLMRHALGTCACVEEFRHLLDSTNGTGRRTQGNFGVIDTSGAAMMFEVAGNTYWMFDASDPTQSHNGYILRTNFSMNGGGSVGIERYRRSVVRIGDFQLGDSLDYRSILRYHARDFSDYSSTPLPVPYPRQWDATTPLGYINSSSSICRHRSVSAVAITGVQSGEAATLSTMWTILGQPATGVAVPYWAVGDPPDAASGGTISPLYDIATKVRLMLFDFSQSMDFLDTYKLRDECGNGVWAWTFPVEDSIFDAGDAMLARWRRDLPSKERMLQAENGFASYALSQLTDAYARLTGRRAFAVANSTSYKDENGKTLENGDIVQLIWAGEDGWRNPPNMEIGNPHWGEPAGDDRLIGVSHAIGENVSRGGTFHFQMIGWQNHTMGYPAVGDRVYLRTFNSNALGTATRYGDAQLFQVSPSLGSYDPLIEGGRTTQPLKGVRPTEAASRFALSPNFPNPFNSSTIIEFQIPYDQDHHRGIELLIFNTLGEIVQTLYSGPPSGGNQRLEWDGRDNRGQTQPSGVYFLQLRDGSATTTRKMLLLK